MNTPKNIAVYWDFENLHIPLFKAAQLRGQVPQDFPRYRQQPKLVDISAIMDYLSGLGDININKAYSHWGSFWNYKNDLQEYAVDLIQLFPINKHGKNGADIRMALDVLQDLTANPHIDVVVIIGGDSDYIPIGQRVRQQGKTIIGVGAKGATSHYWIKACNEFKYYSSLLFLQSPEEADSPEGQEIEDAEDAREIVDKAIRRLIKESGENYALKAAIKPMMLRIDPSFDESNYGFSSFTEFLGHFAHLHIMQGKNDHHVSLEPNAQISQPKLHNYAQILKTQSLRLPQQIESLPRALPHSFRILQRSVKGYGEFKEKLFAALQPEFPNITETDVNKIKAILYRSFVFRLQPIEEESKLTKIVLPDGIKDEEALKFLVFKALTRRVMDGLQEAPNFRELSISFTGTDKNEAFFEACYQEVLKEQAQGTAA
jgi:uncharacterized protein (TIGR00288 family)